MKPLTPDQMDKLWDEYHEHPSCRTYDFPMWYRREKYNENTEEEDCKKCGYGYAECICNIDFEKLKPPHPCPDITPSNPCLGCGEELIRYKHDKEWVCPSCKSVWRDSINPLAPIAGGLNEG